MYKEGLPYLERDFPELDYITSCAVREIATSGDAESAHTGRGTST